MQYANKHYRGSGHSIFVSFEPGEDRCWCYADEARVKPRDGVRESREGTDGGWRPPRKRGIRRGEYS